MQSARWPLHPLPSEGESVLSWLGRIARCYRMDTKNLVKQSLGFDGSLEPLTVHLPTELLSLLSRRTGVSENDISAMTLSTWSPLLLDNLALASVDFTAYVEAFPLFNNPVKRRNKRYRPKISWWPWFRLHDTVVIKACPYCVQTKPTGTVLLIWHLCILLSCPLHRCMLQYCKTYQGSFMCWMNKIQPFHDVPEAIAVMDKRTWAAFTIGRVELPDGTMHGAVWLRLLRALVDELHVPTSRTSFPGAGHIMDIWSSLGLAPRAGMHRWRPYELLPNEIQDKTLLAAAVAFDWIEKKRVSLPGKQARWFLPEEKK